MSGVLERRAELPRSRTLFSMVPRRRFSSTADCPPVYRIIRTCRAEARWERPQRGSSRKLSDGGTGVLTFMVRVVDG